MAKARLKVGDIFVIPLNSEQVGYGQVIATYLTSGFLFAIFRSIYQAGEQVSFHQVISDNVDLLALSLDAKVSVGNWRVVGNVPVVDGFPIPAYKVATSPGIVVVEDFDGKRRRLATPVEEVILPYRTIVAPVRVEKAFRALHGVGTWLDEYGSLVPSLLATTSEMFD